MALTPNQRARASLNRARARRRRAELRHMRSMTAMERRYARQDFMAPTRYWRPAERAIAHQGHWTNMETMRMARFMIWHNGVAPDIFWREAIAHGRDHNEARRVIDHFLNRPEPHRGHAGYTVD